MFSGYKDDLGNIWPKPTFFDCGPSPYYDISYKTPLFVKIWWRAKKKFSSKSYIIKKILGEDSSLKGKKKVLHIFFGKIIVFKKYVGK